MNTDEKDWFCAQLKACQTGMYRLALSILHNQQDAEDAVQDAIYTAYSKLSTLRDADKFSSWILRITSNASYDIIRKRKYTGDIDELEIPCESGTDITDKLALWGAVQSLETVSRQIVVLFYYESMSIKEISSITGVDAGTVKTRLFRARQRLYKALADPCEGKEAPDD